MALHQARRQIHDRINAMLQLLANNSVKCIRARDPGPRIFFVKWKGLRDFLAALSGKPAGKWIAKNGVGAFCFTRAIYSSPAGRIGNVLNSTLCHHHIVRLICCIRKKRL